MSLEIGGEIDRVDGKELSYREFVERYLEKNQPVLISGLMDGWMASKDWVTENGSPNLAFFSIHCGKSKVQVADCGRRDFTDQKRIEMSVSGFISDWQQLSAGKCCCDSGDKDDGRPLLYLKDWHFIKEYPKYVAYTTPKFFVDDWLNLYLDSHPMHMNADMCHDKNEINCSDYRFVYMGAQGTWTPLHADVFRSYSWSANVCGRKLWHFLPPSQCHLLFDQNMKSSVYDIFDNVSNALFPGFKKAVWLECTQEQGEIIFVPSGWYHQVLNLEDTISINHNWFNAYNLSWVWGLLLKDYNEAKEYIEDIRDICDDFESLCQRNLAANTGMNFFDFFAFITRFSFANLTLLYHLVKTDEHPIWASSDTIQHLIANLTSICNVALSMKNVEAFAREDHSACSDLKKILEEPEFIELCVALSRTYTSINGELKEASGRDDKSIRVEASSSYLDFLVAIGFEVSGPDDLIRITENAVLNLGCMDNGWSFRLSSESNHIKPQAVL